MTLCQQGCGFLTYENNIQSKITQQLGDYGGEINPMCTPMTRFIIEYDSVLTGRYQPSGWEQNARIVRQSWCHSVKIL